MQQRAYLNIENNPYIHLKFQTNTQNHDVLNLQCFKVSDTPKSEIKTDIGNRLSSDSGEADIYF